MKNTSQPHGRNRARTPAGAGFSLVEVTIAVAIAAMGFITLLGLLPQGITMARNSAEMSVGSKIIQKLSGEMQSMSWDRITWQGYSPLRYFTSEGMEITASGGTGEEDLASSLTYVASIYIPDKPLDVVLPAGTSSSSSAAAESYLRRVKICVATSADPAFDFASASPLRVTSAYALVAQMGQ